MQEKSRPQINGTIAPVVGVMIETFTVDHPDLLGLLGKEPGRKRRYYHITKKGREALREKVQSWTELCRAVNRIMENSDGQA